MRGSMYDLTKRVKLAFCQLTIVVRPVFSFHSFYFASAVCFELGVSSWQHQRFRTSLLVYTHRSLCRPPLGNAALSPALLSRRARRKHLNARSAVWVFPGLKLPRIKGRSTNLSPTHEKQTSSISTVSSRLGAASTASGNDDAAFVMSPRVRQVLGRHIMQVTS